MRNSGNTDSLVMGLLLKVMVATGAKARNRRIFLASSGRLENAMNAGKHRPAERVWALPTYTHCTTHTTSTTGLKVRVKVKVKVMFSSDAQYKKLGDRVSLGVRVLPEIEV